MRGGSDRIIIYSTTGTEYKKIPIYNPNEGVYDQKYPQESQAMAAGSVDAEQKKMRVARRPETLAPKLGVSGGD